MGAVNVKVGLKETLGFAEGTKVGSFDGRGADGFLVGVAVGASVREKLGGSVGAIEGCGTVVVSLSNNSNLQSTTASC